MNKNVYLILLLVCSVCSYGQGISMGGGSATGVNSFSYGTNTAASGTASIAGGINSVATDTATVAIGDGAEARDKYAIALGKVAYVNAKSAVAIGAYSNVQSDYSLAFGLNNVVPPNAPYSIAIGAGDHARKVGSVAIGRDNFAEGASSVAIGTQNTAWSYGETVLGTYASNYTPLNQYGINLTDRLFVLGNGDSHETRSNALVVLKSGDASFRSGVTIGSLETAIDATTDTKLVVYGGSILSKVPDLAEQVLIGTNLRNEEAKLFIENSGYPHALKIKGKGSTSGIAAYVEGGLTVEGSAKIDGNLTVSGSIAKGAGTFKIDHPLDPKNKYLSHSFVESPDMMNIYNGNVLTDENGDATVILPDYFDALNMDFRYQLTAIGQFSQAIIAKEIVENEFKIKTEKPNVKVSWMVTGIRNDAYAKHNRVKVTEEKPVAEKGKYLHPTAFGLSDSKSIFK
ncbi:hypothetical protein [uncultured Arcticibacterium sp.]|uniref:hypothetical protein n=1 Tax=uncultured Arcticibacterium sp. TaxID=2173042 RepID=UPI0030FAFDB8